ncbi:2-keto-4-pentenoate hydratase [Gordonia jinghuaiqii]|uniref:Fumarylacetoacetate hydrolase family protein n=1 Tax=Gordonia jinghuaiqii TaxID=2758710 RepID=A0A7D7LWK9_9ACTN|nr:fumarylacetoacetate hydrolase family protein [Gordonia jinghuaiqii]MCR5976924.1 2-keto-4-pentenoate hydratase [Gordonia jinghuaiqii]QMT00454.1 fumarylacetoacetate hydrolase family protein [Gordonia jinghuaiqii]
MTSPTPTPAPTADLDAAIVAAAQRLGQALATRVPCAPIRDLIAPDDIASAYRIQTLFNEGRSARVVGRKIGATSEAVQTQLGVDQPDFGVLFEDMAFGDGETVPISGLLQPKAEAEIAFMLERDLADGDLDVEQCRAAIAYATPALEIVDSRITNWDITFADTVADNASAGVYVVGTSRRSLDEYSPVDSTMRMTIDGEVVSEGNGAACLGDPLNAVVWLARRARQFGEPLRAGQLILSGALGPMRPVAPGASVTAEIGELGSVTAHFSSAASE